MKKRPKEVQDWFDFASEDLRSAEILFEEKIYNQASFHSQQCVEKLLKAMLLSEGRHSPKIHDLKELFKKCIDAGLLELLSFKEKIATLSLFYAPTRYPDAIIGSLPERLPNKEDAQEALKTAQALYQLLAQ